MYISRWFPGVLVGLLLLPLTGCGVDDSAIFKGGVSAPPQPTVELAEMGGGPTSSPDSASDSAEPAATPTGAPGENANDEASDGPRREVEVGDDGKGHYGGGYLSEVVKARFTMEDKIQNIQLQHSIKNCLAAYKANHLGNGPKTHAEFMAQVIEVNGIALPEIAANERFLYDPNEEQLYIVELREGAELPSDEGNRASSPATSFP